MQLDRFRKFKGGHRFPFHAAIRLVPNDTVAHFLVESLSRSDEDWRQAGRLGSGLCIAALPERAPPITNRLRIVFPHCEFQQTIHIEMMFKLSRDRIERVIHLHVVDPVRLRAEHAEQLNAAPCWQMLRGRKCRDLPVCTGCAVRRASPSSARERQSGPLVTPMCISKPVKA